MSTSELRNLNFFFITFLDIVNIEKYDLVTCLLPMWIFDVLLNYYHEALDICLLPRSEPW